MEEQPISLVTDATKVAQSLKNNTQNLKEAARNIDESLKNVKETSETGIFKICRKFAIPIFTFTLGIVTTSGLNFFYNYSQEPFSRLKIAIEKEIDNKYFLMLLEDELGLYQAETLTKALKQKHLSGELDDESSEFKTLAHFEENVLNKNNYYYQERNTTDNTTGTEASETSASQKSVEQSEKKVEMVAVEFASNQVLRGNIAAACRFGQFFNNEVELRNLSNPENNAIVKASSPLDCSSKARSKCESNLGSEYILLQVPFSVAEKLYPELIDVLPSCSYALAELLSE